jgi:DNA repair exonuclease SbcCD ATPase subunit
LIVLKNLRWKNLLSFGNTWTEIQLDRSPSTLVVGQSGSGKSTIIEALTFVLFGKPFRKIQKKTLCNSVNQKDLVVEIEFESNNNMYKIVRGMKPDIFQIYCNENLMNQDPSVRDYQKYLDEHILKMNYKTFTQVIVLGYANHTPFMLLGAQERRGMVDELLDTSIFVKMYKKLFNKNVELRNNLTIVEHDISNFKSSISVLLSNLKKLKEKEKSREDSILTEIEQIQSTVNLLQEEANLINEEIKKLDISISDHDLYKRKFQELNTIKSRFEINCSKINNELAFFEENVNCPMCLQGISHEHKAEMETTRKSNLVKITEGISKTEQTTNKIKETLDKYAKVLREIVLLGNDISSKNSAISTYQKVITQKQKELSDLSAGDSVSKDTEAKIQELKTELEEAITRKETLVSERHYNDAAASLLKDEGIKARIIKEYIPIINKLVNDYLDAMGFSMKFVLDENFEERILSRFRDELKYQNLSQGEQARLSLALTLSWRKLAELRNSINCNVLFLDEVMDASISAADMESVLGLLEVVAKENNLWIISHKPDQLSDKIYSMITITKDGNFSKMVTT